ncbi:type II secretion system protein GspN [Deltaproteobacteria bacterium]|nr:type II secretion system protein GspN [Deltaproteobacteria bacterium]
MTQVNWKNKKWIWYTLYCVLLALAISYYRFPSDALKDYFNENARRINPLLNVSFERLTPSFPFGLKLIQAEFSLEENPETALFKADVITFRPRLWSFFQKYPEYQFQCSAYGGKLKGRTFSVKKDSDLLYNASIVLEDIDMDENFPVSAIIGDRLEGTLNGNITYAGEKASPADGTGDAILTLSAGRIKLLEPVFDLESIEFDEVLLNFALKDQKLNVSNVELRGKEMHGKASGTIYLGKELLESSVDLKGTIELYADLFVNSPKARDVISFFKQGLQDGKLAFNIKGTIKDPRINFI